jgi:hypothetical protein
LRACRRGALSSTIKIVNFFIVLRLEFEETLFSRYLTFSFSDLLEVNKVNTVFNEDKGSISGSTFRDSR